MSVSWQNGSSGMGGWKDIVQHYAVDAGKAAGQKVLSTAASKLAGKGKGGGAGAPAPARDAGGFWTAQKVGGAAAFLLIIGLVLKGRSRGRR